MYWKPLLCFNYSQWEGKSGYTNVEATPFLICFLQFWGKSLLKKMIGYNTRRGARMPMNEIEELNKHFIEELSPLRIYLFGSFVNGTNSRDSDFDFYIVVRDDVFELAGETAKAYRAIRRIKQRLVDIIVGTQSRFERRKEFPSVERSLPKRGGIIWLRRRGNGLT